MVLSPLPTAACNTFIANISQVRHRDTVALIASNKAGDFGKSICHRIARHFDAGGIEPGMGVDRLVLPDLVPSDSGAEMQHAVDAAPLKHDARGHGLGQA